jgi:N4-gp56 family major capsid protein
MANRYNIAGTDTGVFDQLDNVVLDVWSQEIRFTAQPLLRFEALAKNKTDLQATPGSKIKFLRYNALTGPSPIAETASIETETLATSYREMGTIEHAKALGFRELVLRQAMVDVLADASTALGQHYAVNRDMNIRDAVYWGGVPDLSALYYGSEAATQPSIAGTKTIYGDGSLATRSAITTGATGLFCMKGIRAGVEYLATNKVPKFGGDAYICVVHPHQGIAIRQETGWISAVQYADPTRIFNGEIGRIEDVRFIETTQVQIWKGKTEVGGNHNEAEIWTDNACEYFDRDTTSTNKKRISDGSADATIPDWLEGLAATTLPGVDVYRAVLLGEGAIGVADVLPVEMRDNGIQDFGRTRSLGYYAIYGTGVIEETFGCVIETA